MTDPQSEIARLHAFILQVSERLYLAASVLAVRAERREKRNDTAQIEPRREPDLVRPA
jgi:hypothetical protein